MQKDKLYDCLILNFWWTNNFGAILTCYALYNAITDIGYKTAIINYCASNIKKDISRDFADRHFLLTNLCFSYEDLKKLNEFASVFIVGSDQVFRDTYAWRHNKTIWQLDFVNPVNKKISYAASFGTDEFDGEIDHIEYIKYYLNSFDRISVRETSGVSICNRTFGVEAERMPDPVFLLDSEQWIKLFDKTPVIQKQYIFKYILDKTARTEKVTIETAERLKINHIVNMDDAQKSNENITVEDWLNRLYSAEFVVTDSFHGVCFSLIFNKQFLCIINNNRGCARFDTLKEIYPIKYNFIDLTEFEKNQEIMFNICKIDYRLINKIMLAERMKGLNWLKEVIGTQKIINKYIEYEKFHQIIEHLIHQQYTKDKELFYIKKKLDEFGKKIQDLSTRQAKLKKPGILHKLFNRSI